MNLNRPSRHFQLGFLLVTAVLWGDAVAHAALVIEIEDTTIDAGGLGTIDIFLRSDGTSSDNVAIASYRVAITTISESGGDLQFQASSNDIEVNRQNSLEQLEPSYVFFGDANPTNFLATRQDPNRRLLQADDSTFSLIDGSFTDRTIGPTNLLLARIELQHITPSPDTATGQYRISLVQDPGFTTFLDSTFTPIDINPDSFVNPANATDNFAFGAGLVTVGVVAVPEPSSIVVLCGGVLACIVRRRRPTKSVRKS
jgi:hypothetical protein